MILPNSTAWRQELEGEEMQPLVALLLTAAEQRLEDPLPGDDVVETLNQPVPVIDMANLDPTVSRYIRALAVARSLFYYAPLFALAFHLRGDERYEHRALDWLDVSLRWPRWDCEGQERGDIGAAYAIIGTVLATQWLGEKFLGEQRRQAFVEAWRREGIALGRWKDSIHPNNHPWFSRAGLGLLVATHPECFTEPQELQDTLIRTFRQSVPATFSEQGEYNDGLEYALMSLTGAFLFADALWARHRIRLFDQPQLRAFTEFCLDTIPPDGGNLPDEHEAIPGQNWLMSRPLLAYLAALFDDRELQAQLRASIPDTDRWQRGAKLRVWFRGDLPNPSSDPESVSYSHGVYDLMWLPSCLPSSGPAEKPFPDGARYRRYEHTGTCIARNGQLGEKTLLWFRAGCASQKDMSNHNGFVWYPAGRRVIESPRSDLDCWRDDSLTYFKDWNGFFHTSRASNVILIDGAGQEPTHQNGWPGQGEFEWLNRGKVPPTSRVVAEEHLPDGVRWTGEAQNAYPNRLKLWRRSVELQNWLNLRVRDRIETVHPDARIDWLLHSPGRWEGAGQSFTVNYEGVRVDIEFRGPSAPEVAIEETPAGQGRRKTTYLRASMRSDRGVAEFDVAMTATVPD